LIDALRRSNDNIAYAAVASGRPRRVFFELSHKHSLKACEFSDADFASARPAVPRAGHS
jgi:hypothetical protein